MHKLPLEKKKKKKTIEYSDSKLQMGYYGDVYDSEVKVSALGREQSVVQCTVLSTS